MDPTAYEDEETGEEPQRAVLEEVLQLDEALRVERYRLRCAEEDLAMCRVTLAKMARDEAVRRRNLAEDVAGGRTLWTLDQVFFLLHGRKRKEGELW